MVASWFLTQEVAGSSPFTVITNRPNSVKSFTENSIELQWPQCLHSHSTCTHMLYGSCLIVQLILFREILSFESFYHFISVYIKNIKKNIWWLVVVTLVLAFGFLSQNFRKWLGPMNCRFAQKVTLYTCRQWECKNFQFSLAICSTIPSTGASAPYEPLGETFTT